MLVRRGRNAGKEAAEVGSGGGFAGREEEEVESGGGSGSGRVGRPRSKGTAAGPASTPMGWACSVRDTPPNKVLGGPPRQAREGARTPALSKALTTEDRMIFHSF